MYTALAGQLAAFKHLEVVANNLANMGTTGFRAERVEFEVALQQQGGGMQNGRLNSDIQQPNGLASNTYVGIRGSYTDQAQGYLEETGNETNAAITGKGMFVVNTPSGPRYTRAGAFVTDATGKLVTPQGHAVQGTSGDINISGTSIKISQTGDVIVDGASIAKLRIVDTKPGNFLRESSQLFKLREGATATEVSDPQVKGGAVEGSNVNAVRELTEMIMVSKLFDSFKNAQDANSNMNQLANKNVGSAQG